MKSVEIHFSDKMYENVDKRNGVGRDLLDPIVVLIDP